MEPLTIVLISYSLTAVLSAVSVYYISSHMGDTIYNKMVK